MTILTLVHSQGFVLAAGAWSSTLSLGLVCALATLIAFLITLAPRGPWLILGSTFATVGLLGAGAVDPSLPLVSGALAVLLVLLALSRLGAAEPERDRAISPRSTPRAFPAHRR